MAQIKEFKGLRPAVGYETEVAELPYDVVNTKEAKAIAHGNPHSFFHISRAEIDLADTIDPYSKEVYAKGKANLEQFIKEGVLRQDKEENMYLYTLVMNERRQTGLVACVHIDDYLNNIVKKHEHTREDKELDRTRHLNILNANTGPVFLLYKEDGTKKHLFEIAGEIVPEYDFIAEDGIRHIVRVIKDQELIKSFKKSFTNNTLYIADGHHRAASAVRVGVERRTANPQWNANDESNYFLSVIFPHDQLHIMPYNRAVKDLNGRTPAEFLAKIAESYKVEQTGIASPTELHTFSMYLNKQWYTLKPQFAIESHPINSLDVKILQDTVLDPILGIKDPRTDKRIDFIGGIRGTQELEKVVDSGNYAVAISMYPTTIEQLIDVSDSGNVMPPKSTWFEPKLRSGLVVHLLD